MEHLYKAGLYGEYKFTLDDKNRFFVPAKLREKLLPLGKRLILARGLDKCLLLYPLEEWKTLVQKVSHLPFTLPEARQFTRHLFSGAYECEIDSQGRIPLPQHLKEYAGITREIVIIGVGDRIEIWSKDKWEKYFQKTDASIEEIASHLKEYEI
ncbi:division/cell wall cluster transcriptional repressor MraZ [Candidatus Calescamantes bacterium]|nr:division/cell wall cluster transcriptional repressor MraZ [Candidatus Calescamantes bacterium]